MEPVAVPHGSPQYWATVQLRRDILRWPIGLEFTDEELASEHTDIHCGVFEEERCVGCLVLTPLDRDELKMRQVAVLPELQGTGIGRRMVEWSERYAREQGYRCITLHARDIAVPFYVRLDYQVEGEPFEEVTIPHRRMRKVV